VIRQGALLANGRPVAPLQPGDWYHVEVSCLLLPETEKMLGVSVRTASGDAWSLEVPYESYRFERPTEVQLTSLGVEASKVFVDNLIATVSR